VSRPTVAEMWADVLARVEQSPDGCLIFPGATSRGYGTIRRSGVNYMAHRIAYEAANGPIPVELCVDHMCHNPRECPGGLCSHRRCVNPDHLRLLTREENSALASSKLKPFCVNGHPRTPETTRPNGHGRNVCIECHRARQRSAYAAQKLASA